MLINRGGVVIAHLPNNSGIISVTLHYACLITIADLIDIGKIRKLISGYAKVIELLFP